jgi:hypothetical protein
LYKSCGDPFPAQWDTINLILNKLETESFEPEMETDV